MRERSAHSVNTQSQIPWQRRREALLLQACQRIEALIGKGNLLTPAFHVAAHHFDGRRLPAGRRLHASVPTLIRYWYRWRQDRDPAVFYDRRRAPCSRPQIPRKVIVQLLGEAVLRGITLSEVHRRFGGPDGLGFSYRTLTRTIKCKGLRKLAALQRQTNAMRKELRAQLGAAVHRKH